VAEQEAGKWKLFAGLVLLASVMALGVALWFVFSADGERIAQQPDAIPVARAPAGPDREKPEDRGGTVVPDTDKQVYETFQPASSRQGERVERLLPAEEIPLADPPPKPVAKVAAVEVQPADDTVQTPDQVVIEPAKPAIPAPEPRPTSKPTPKAAPPKAAIPKVAVVTVPSGSWQVQLAAVRDEAAAVTTWKRISGKQRTLLSGMSPTVSKTTTDKGVFFRLRTGSFSSRDKADAFCSSLKKAGQDCLVAKAK
jgi:cell division septation protein DedD